MKHRLDALIASDDIISTAVDIEIFVVLKYIINAVNASRILVLYANINSGDAEVTEQDMAVCDVNGDGMINAVDASLVLAYYADLAKDPELTLETFLEGRK